MATSLTIKQPRKTTPPLRPKRRNLIVHDLVSPNIVRLPIWPAEAKAENYGSMAVLEALRRRINMRSDFEIVTRHRGDSIYKRLRCASILISAPNPEQAELFIQAIHDFAKTLDGKWLAPKPEAEQASAAAQNDCADKR